MRLPGERCKCCGDLVDAGAYVGCGGDGVVLGLMSRISLRDGEAEPALDERERGVPQPVGGDLLPLGPWNLLAAPFPQAVVSPCRDRTTVEVAQHAAVGLQAASTLRVIQKVCHERR